MVLTTLENSWTALFFFLMKRFKFTDHTFKPFHPPGIIYPKQMKADVHT